MSVPNTSTFKLSDVIVGVTASNNETVNTVPVPFIDTPPAGTLKGAFRYSKSPDFDVTYGANYLNRVLPDKMSYFRNYQQKFAVYRVPGSEIVTNAPAGTMAMYPCDNVGYNYSTGLYGVLDAQYSTSGRQLYAVTSNQLFVWDEHTPKSGSGSLTWDAATLLLTLPGSEIFSTKIFVTPFGDFIGGNQGTIVICTDGVLRSFAKFSTSSIVGIERSFEQNGTLFDQYLWVLNAAGVIYYTILASGYFTPVGTFNLWFTVSSFTFPLGWTTQVISRAVGSGLSGDCSALVGVGRVTYAGNTLNNGHGSAMFIMCGGELYFFDSFASSVVGPTYSLYKYSRGFNYNVIDYSNPGTPYLIRVIPITAYGNFFSWYGPSNAAYGINSHFDSNATVGVVEAYVTSMPVSVTSGVTTYYTGWVLLDLFWAPTSYGDGTTKKYNPELHLSCFIPTQIYKIVNNFVEFDDLNIYNGTPPIGSHVLVNPVAQSSYFAAKLTNSFISWVYPVAGLPVTSISLTNSATSASFSITTDHSYYKLLVDVSGRTWFSLTSPAAWYRYGIDSLSFTVSANTTGKQRFTWLHMLNGDSGIVISSIPIFQSA